MILATAVNASNANNKKLGGFHWQPNRIDTTPQKKTSEGGGAGLGWMDNVW